MSIDSQQQPSTPPVLRLRSAVLTELIVPSQKIKQPNGPWIAHPDLIDEEIDKRLSLMDFPPDATRDDHRKLWKEDMQETLSMIKQEKLKCEDFEWRAPIAIHPKPKTHIGVFYPDHELSRYTEKYFVGAHIYLRPNFLAPPFILDSFGQDWGLNARGIYYHHYYSPGWVTADHKLWLPSLQDVDWNDTSEEERRARARTMMKHILHNERWNKSEYAWEADAWKDVFGMMRDDPVLAVDKHEYHTMGQKRHPVTCLLTGESKFIKRIPDATFGLATFKAQDYQSPIAERDLDLDRLESLCLHRYCGLHSDPSWGKANLVFPFAVYEAKAWRGDHREARRQACSAGAVYLDMLDRLTRVPGKPGQFDGAYQTQESRNSQVFVFTSFGAHWHILVGYRRPRLAREHAGHPGMSKTVYDFQRIWSGRVSTERRAWELLSLIDQIHLWGATDFRDFVIQHLKPWHEFGKRCYVNDIDFVTTSPDKRIRFVEGYPRYYFPDPCMKLAEWTRHFPKETQLRFHDALAHFLLQANSSYRLETRAKSDAFPSLLNCIIGACSSSELVGYPLASPEEVEIHLRDFHSEDLGDREPQMWEVGDRRFMAEKFIIHDDDMECIDRAGVKRKFKDVKDDEDSDQEKAESSPVEKKRKRRPYFRI